MAFRTIPDSILGHSQDCPQTIRRQSWYCPGNLWIEHFSRVWRGLCAEMAQLISARFPGLVRALVDAGLNAITSAYTVLMFMLHIIWWSEPTLTIIYFTLPEPLMTMFIYAYLCMELRVIWETDYMKLLSIWMRNTRSFLSPEISFNNGKRGNHYSDVIIGAMASPITSLAIVYSTVYSGADQRNH